LTISYSFVDLDKYIWKYNPFSNMRLNVGVFVGVLLIFLTIYTPIGQDIFKLTYVPVRYLWILAVWVVFNIWVVEFAKFMYSKNR
jgi:magnesium-transporting ATPase (P-type)